MKKKLTNFEIMAITNILGDKDSLLNSSSKKISKQILWDLDTNMETLSSLRQRIFDAQNEINISYTKNDKIVERIDEKGTKLCEIKEEFMSDYKNDMDEIMNIENEVDIVMVDFDLLPDDICGKDFRSIKFMVKKSETEEDK